MSALPAGRVFVVSGPSGAGKGTLITGVLEWFPDLRPAVSATTRRPRPRERDGREYHFLAPEEFARRVERGDFLEHVDYTGARYGTLRCEIARPLAEGHSVVLELELRGARAVRRELPDAVAIFIAPPSLEELGRRLEQRGTEGEAEIAARLRVSAGELAHSADFDHRIVNVDAEVATAELAALIARVLGRG